MTVARVGLTLLLLGPAGRAGAFVLGGGAADKDCRVAYDGVDATDGASQATCVDGAPCDADGTADGTCRFMVALCVDVAEAGCQSASVDRIDVAGLPLAPPALPAPDGTCGAPSEVDVPVGGVAGSTLLAWGGGDLRDVDYLNLCCVAADDPLGAARCAVQVDLAAAGCAAVPRRAEHGFEAARARVDRAIEAPGRARRLLGRAARKTNRARKAGQKLAATDPCGNALGLVASHAGDVLRAAR
jgi:hypothetical protein